MGFLYRVGDVFKWPGKAKKLRVRVREIEMMDHWNSELYVLQLFSVIDYSPDDPSKTTWGWLDRRNDFHFNRDGIRERRLELVERGPEPPLIQMDLFTGEI